MAGLALTGAAALPVAYYTHRHLTREEEPQTPDEASLDLAATDGIRLGDRLRGLWDLRLVGGDAELPGLPREGLQLVLDVAPKGRGLIGYLDTPERSCASARTSWWTAIRSARKAPSSFPRGSTSVRSEPRPPHSRPGGWPKRAR